MEFQILDQVVFDGITGRSTTRGDANLVKDRGEVAIDRARTDDQLFSHLLIGESLGHHAQHLHLPRRQSVRIDQGFRNWWNRG